MRPSWDATWLELAKLMAARSRCPSGAGAVAVDASQRVIQSGYAGPPATYRPQLEVLEWELDLTGCQAYCQRAATAPAGRDPGYLDCPSTHGEINTLVKADSTRLPGGSFYISSVPCFACAKAVSNSGVVRVLWYASEADAYRDPERVKDMLSLCGIEWQEVHHG